MSSKKEKQQLIELSNKINNVKLNTNENKPLKPIVKWSGGKKDELPKILPHIPSNYNTYIEPFIGGGALYFHLNPNKAVINDVHKELIDFYQSIKNGDSNKIYEFMKEHPNNEETYYKVRAYKSNECLENAKRFYYLRKTCFRGMLRYNKKGEFNIPFGRYKTYNFEDIKNIKYEQLLKRTDIFNKDFEYIFENFNDENNFYVIRSTI